MSLQLLSYLVSLGFRADLEPQDTPATESGAQAAAADIDCDEASNLQFVLAL